MNYKSIKVKIEDYNKLKEIDSSISQAVSVLLLGRTKVEQTLNKVEQTLNKVEERWNKVEEGRITKEDLIKLENKIQRLFNTRIEEINQDISSLIKRNGLK